MLGRKIYRKLYQISEFLNQHIISILLTLLVVGIGVGLFGSYHLTINLVNSQAEQNASVSINTINETRRLYSEKVVEPLQDLEGVTLSPEYHKMGGSIPLPATFSIALSESLSQQMPGMAFRLFSDYPFPHRQDKGGPQDQFERNALQALRRHPDQPYMRREKLKDGLVYRYAQAVVMEPSCVQCHNSWPNSPKKDWQVGDVRGVISITQPMGAMITLARQGLRQIYLILVVLGALAILGVILVIGRFRFINDELEKKVEDKTVELQRLVNLDGLTQISNRYHFDQTLMLEWNRAIRNKSALSLILCDIDCFKQFNDHYGHPCGDQCLKSVADQIQQSIRRSGEIAARYGGEEFVVLLPNVASVKAEEVALSLRDRLHGLQIPHEASSVRPFVTLSMGVATVIPQLGEDYADFIRWADEALYQAKRLGRDRHQVWHRLKEWEARPT